MPDSSIREFHREGLGLAETAMCEAAFNLSDFSGITMSGDPRKMPEAKMLIWEFRRKMCQLLETGSRKEVFRMNVQLFPVTKTVKGKK